ncbi:MULTISPECIES: AtpZ/AtpI family protein [Campylobacter]|uniref:ATPase-related protein n=1 Tax=Campylobacter vicugnae TaxID=1660076 RepID=A0A1X9T1M6_9BACT|nr:MULTISPECIES: AtpZ/AtpI family protein [Campylobacter]ARR02434.1 putative ATPase-related protein [Campylobacter sp. RM8964]MBQ3167777.1 AtpZ/AtpI family protein [Campylobacter sp.]MBQ7135774.1 AtpZ/AtpI family protein [Campylobacter sp.]MBQ8609967.1 AtpZ/AtpI family protein [Campylobacter sp.]MBQ8819604.1 AtpZ/AtpI family protein [Campylobacter sp.]
MSDKSKKINTAIKAADSLSLGISIVVAILMGFGIGWGLKELTGSNWGLGIGIVIGVGAAINNIYKAYKSQVKSYAEFDKKQKKDEI